LHGAPAIMAETHAFVAPHDVLWNNDNIGYLQRQARCILGLACVYTIVIIWTAICESFFSSLNILICPSFYLIAIKATVVLSFSNLEKLVSLLPWLSILTNLPPSIYGIISGILPPLVLSIAISLVPIVFRLIGTLSGTSLKTILETNVQAQYYFFIVFNVLIMKIVSQSVQAAWSKFSGLSLGESMDYVASQIPTNSTFFINYILLLGLVGISTTRF
jgi:hypothetical protein